MPFHLLFHFLSIPAPTYSPCSISTSQQAQSDPCTSHKRRLRESIEILMAAAVKTALYVICGGSAAVPRQRVWTLGTAMVTQWQMEMRWSKMTKKEGICEHMRAKFESPAGVFTCIQLSPRWFQLLQWSREPHPYRGFYPSIIEISVAHFLVLNGFVSLVKVTLCHSCQSESFLPPPCCSHRFRHTCTAQLTQHTGTSCTIRGAV